MTTNDSASSLSSAMEDYLEAIYHLEQERRIARVRDIAQRLDVKMSSVTSALKSLASRDLIKYDPHQYITLTRKGIAAAREIVRSHKVLKRFLTQVLHVEESISEENACRIEHHLDRTVIERLVDFVEFLQMCPVDQTRWLDNSADACGECVDCIQKALEKVHNRSAAQKAALADGMTLAAALTASQVIVENVKGTPTFKKSLAREGLGSGSIVEVESRDPDSGNLEVRIKGYNMTLTEEQASKILVKPF
ncbi:MAG: metal-dependent transcriptional regulator [Thermodesulfobacteriota bacterium]